MDSMASSPLPYAEGTLVEDTVEKAEGGSGKLPLTLAGSRALTGTELPPALCIPPTPSSSPPAALLEPGPGTGSCTQSGRTQ